MQGSTKTVSIQQIDLAYNMPYDIGIPVVLLRYTHAGICLFVLNTGIQADRQDM